MAEPKCRIMSHKEHRLISKFMEVKQQTQKVYDIFIAAGGKQKHMFMDTHGTWNMVKHMEN